MNAKPDVYCPNLKITFGINKNSIPFADGNYICECGGLINRKNVHVNPTFTIESEQKSIIRCSDCGATTSRVVLEQVVCTNCCPRHEVNYCSVCTVKRHHYYDGGSLVCSECGTINPRDKKKVYV